MALDLQLFAIPQLASYVLKKAGNNIDYARDLDKITAPGTLQLHLQMIKADPDGTPVETLNELYNDSLNIIKLYPQGHEERYNFYSKHRGYSTLDYLFEKHSRSITTGKYVSFFSGHEINPGLRESACFQYMDNKQIVDFYAFIQSLEFKSLMRYYDHEDMEQTVYKLAGKEQLPLLEDEFLELKEFYHFAESIGAFVIIKIA